MIARLRYLRACYRVIHGPGASRWDSFRTAVKFVKPHRRFALNAGGGIGATVDDLGNGDGSP